MATPKGPSLIEFAAAKTKRTCRVCELPELQEILAARQAGVSYPRIIEWLVEVRGYEANYVTKARLEKHFQDKHDV